MREQLQLRLKELTEEHEAGERMLADLDARRAELRQTLLRIGGAMQVLEELLGAGEPVADDPARGEAADDGRLPAGAASGSG